MGHGGEAYDISEKNGDVLVHARHSATKSILKIESAWKVDWARGAERG